jgi:menaquinone-specific isochorismate synthase
VSTPDPLLSRTHRLAPDVEPDLLTWGGDDATVFLATDHALAGRGSAHRIGPAPREELAAEVARALGAVSVVGDHEAPPLVAVGALPFDPAAPGELGVPTVLVRRDTEGQWWLTVVGSDDGTQLAARWHRTADEIAASSPRPTASAALTSDNHEGAAESDEPMSGRAEATSFEVCSTIEPAVWTDAVTIVRDRIRAGVARKVVLAREVVVTADHAFSVMAVLTRLRVAFPGCMVFAVDGFVGASPELLVARRGSRVRAHPLAGTAPRSPDPQRDRELAAALLASAKDRSEHRITIDMVHDALLPFCSFLDEEAEPSIVAVANVQHLGTMVEGELSSPPVSVLDLVAALHPTPAVGGDPTRSALELITAHEGFDRGCYAGAVGWVDAAGDGCWAVGIRSAQLSGATARVFAGVGVVADSDPEAELAETRAKFQAMLAALIRP